MDRSTSHPSPGPASFHAVVHGRVQGVGFRYWVQTRARGLHVSGSVRNLPSGDVEVQAEGDRVSLETLIAALHRGPAGARVDGVEIVWREPAGRFQGFDIGF
jgi:acylphosphatase